MYKKKLHSLVILIPSYNELDNLKEFLLRLKKNFNIFVIDDHSSDGTHKWLIKNKISFIRNSRNLGYEKTLIKGMKIMLKKNKYKSILTMDADGQHTVKCLKKFTHKKISLHDIIVGKRNRTNRYIENIISNVFYKKNKIRDPLCGLKLYKCKILKKINFNIIGNYFLVDLLSQCMNVTKKVTNISIKIRQRHGSARIGNTFESNVKLFKVLIYCLSKKLNLYNSKFE